MSIAKNCDATTSCRTQTEGLSRSAHFAALDTGAWTVPQKLLFDGVFAASPQVRVNSGDRLTIAFAVPLNEVRGVYLTRSQVAIRDADHLTWSPPGLVFDAADAGWEMLDHPRLTLGPDDSTHLLWTRYSFPPTSRPLSLHYASISSTLLNPAVEDSSSDSNATASPALAA